MELKVISTLPSPTMPPAIGMMMPQGGFGDFRITLQYNRLDCPSIHCKSKKQGENETSQFILPLSKNLNTLPNLILLSASSRSLPSLSASNQQSNFKAKHLPNT
jgi:hypothetical protein